MMTQKMINTVTERINLMMKDERVQEIMMSFKTKEEGQNWIIKAATATLMGR